MKLNHKTPCDECPWRRKHPAGWLGGYEAEQFTQQVQHDGPALPCHKTIANGQEAKSVCAGALIFMNNSCKVHKDEKVQAMADQVGKDTENVFQWSREFLDYHNDPEAVFNKIKSRMQDDGPETNR